MSGPTWLQSLFGWLSGGSSRKELEAAARVYREYAHDLRNEFAVMRQDIAELKERAEECERDRAQMREKIEKIERLERDAKRDT